MKQYIYRLKYVAAIIAMLVCFNDQSMAGNARYAKAIVHAVPRTGAGTVYIDNNTSQTEKVDVRERDGNVSFELHARPNEGYAFVGWYSAETGGNRLSTNQDYTASIYTTSSDEDNPATTHYYGRFQALPVFYFSATAEVIPPGGGTTNVSHATSAYGTELNSTSATTSATFTATANSGYDFIGWYSDEGLTTQVSTSATYIRNITSSSKDSGSPTNTTLYARFEPLPTFYFSASAVATPAAYGTATVNKTTTSVQGERYNSTSASTTEFIFSATPIASARFLGWSTTAAGAIVSTANPYQMTMISDSKDSNNPSNTTLYARFQPYATSMTASPSAMTVYVGRTSSSAIAHTLEPAGAYDGYTTYESDHPEFATVDNEGVVMGVAPGTATITVKSLKDDNSTVAATATVNVTVKNRVEEPVVSAEPTVDDGGATTTVSMTCATEGTVIYYTTDGSTPDPSAVGGDNPTKQYDDSHKPVINDQQTVKAIAVKSPANALWDNSEVTVFHYSACMSEEPEIEIEGNSSTGKATVTITGEAGATIYYTTDGTAPTTSSAVYTAPITDVAFGTVIKAFAKSGSCRASAVVSKEAIFSCVEGGIVRINDLEDHNWTYYNGVDASVDGGNYNTNYLGKLYSPNPRNVKITYKANGGAVSIDESETQFVYYKTIEESATSGEYAYQVISNPFSKRPNGKGFGGWKIKEGADYIKGYNDEATLPLDAEIVFNNLPYTSVNCISAEIELEAVWVNLNNIVRRTNTGNFTYSTTGGTYETNILVIQSNHTGTITTTSPVTIMMVEPDGSSDYRGTYTFSGNIIPNNTGVTKIEFTRWNSTNTLNCNNHSVTVGRGMTTTSQCASYVTGVTGSTQNQQQAGRQTYTANLNYHLKLESGTFTDVSFIAGTEGTNGYVICNGTSNQVKGTLGNDYDRAKGDNTKLTVTDELFLGYRPTYANGNQNNANFTCWVKSGNLCSGKNVTNTTFDGNGAPNGGYYGDANQVFYASVGGAQTNIGKRKLYVEGGILSGIAGGIDANNNATDETFFIRMTGGTVRGVVYGSGAFAEASGIRRFVITGGTINGWVAAGCNGTDPTQSGGTLPSDTYVYIGGTSHIGNTTNLTLNTSSDGNVFGAGSGNAAQATTGQVNNSNVVIADESYIKNNVFGGGNFGYSNATASLYVTGGEVNGSVFGGSNQKQGNTVSINMTDGQVNSGIYGGSNVTGTISGNVTMNINGGQVGVDAEHTANIHGGGYGSATVVSGNVDLTLGEEGQETKGVTVYGDVYGGSALGRVNTNTSNHTNVTLNKGAIHGNMYGGALGDNSTEANVNGPVTVTVNGGSVTLDDKSAGVFGCNNINGRPQSTVTVTVTGTDPEGVDNVFGGGNRADYIPPTGTPNYPTVTMSGGTVNNSMYGGGNEADIKGNANVTMTGGTVKNRIFGGGNKGSVGTFTSTTTVDGHAAHSGCTGKPNEWSIGGDCKVIVSGGTVGDLDSIRNDVDYGYVFGASRGETKDPATDPDIDFRAYVNNTDVTISGTAFIIGGVYGGSENGHVKGNTYVKIQGGQIGCGIGKREPYSDDMWETAANAAASGSAAAILSSSSDVTECPCWPFESPYKPYDKYGAADGGAPTGSDGHTFFGNVFGGGSGYWPYKKADNSGYAWLEKAGLVEGSTKVEITGGHILTSVYGGNELTDVTGDSCVVIMTGGTLGVPRTLAQIAAHPVTCYLFGAGKGDQRTYFNKRTSVQNVRVAVGGTAAIFGSVFGGGEDGHVKGNVKIDITGSTIGTWGTSYVDGNIFGAGRGFSGEALTAGLVLGNIEINIKDGKILGSVYGGGRLGSVGTYMVAANDPNYGKMQDGDEHGVITINISGGVIGNNHEYKLPDGNWTNEWKASNNMPNTEFGTTDTDKNRLTHTKGGNVFAGCMGRLTLLDGTTNPIWPDLGKAKKTIVNISGGTIKSNVYGGGELGVITDSTTINITGGTIGSEVGGNVDGSYTFGSVFGGGYGSEDNVNGTSTTDGTVNARDYAGLVSGNTDINISGGHIWASVYGGGELAKVDGSTDIDISGSDTEIGKNMLKDNGYVKYGGYRMGNVFGGGKGSLAYVPAGLITGNTTVLIRDGKIYHNVYGGGALGSVGTFTYDGTTGLPVSCAENTGTTDVTITGGVIGINGHDNGMVNGSSRGGEGRPTATGYTNLDKVAWVNHSNVVIGTEQRGPATETPHVKGSVYGGGENGHNLQDTKIDIFSGWIGEGIGDFDHGNVYGAGCGTDTYTYNNTEYSNPKAGLVHGNSVVNVKGGLIERNIYGAGSMGTTDGSATVTITGGLIMGNVYGGPKGSENAQAEVANTILADCGENTLVDINYPVDCDTTKVYIGGSVFGGGEAGLVKGNVTVNMKKGLVKNDLYGGGALANTNIDNATDYGTASESISGTSTKTTKVNLTGGFIGGNVFGGGLGRKTTSEKAGRPAYVYGDVLVELNKTTASDDCVVRGVVHGANNYNGSPKGEVTVHIYKTVDDGANIKATQKNNTTYNLKAVYGGGNEAAYVPVSTSTNTANVIIEGCDLTSVETVYGGGNAASVPGSHVQVNSCYEIGTVFGGGNGLTDMDDGSPNPGAHVGYKEVNFTPTTSMTRDEYYEALDAAFETQKSTLSYGTGISQVSATGGTIHKIYGGSNTRGNVRIKSDTYIDEANDECPLTLGEVYGGGNEAFMEGGSSLTLGCISRLNQLYGGANAADVGGDVVLTVTSGRFNRVFGGNNQSGTINGSITVNIEETGCHPIIIGELYGCGNLAPYTKPAGKTEPTVNVKSFTSIGRVFGGGLGEEAVVTANPTVNINEIRGQHQNDTFEGEFITLSDGTANYNILLPAHTAGTIGAIGTVYGGGNAAPVVGNTNVNIGTLSTVNYVSGNDHSDKTVVGVSVTGNVFGAGLGATATVSGNTNVTVGK